MDAVATAMKSARERRGWTQAEAAQKLGVSQGYVSLLESGARPVSARLAETAFRTFGLPPTVLPEKELSLSPDRLPSVLGSLGYAPFGYLRGRLFNPASVLLAALCQNDLSARVVEALPWLALHFPHMNREWLVERAKLNDVQNRLGYVVTLATQVAVGSEPSHLEKLLQSLEPSRLAREGTLCHDSMTETERNWLREQRPPEAKHWNLLTDLSRDNLSYA